MIASRVLLSVLINASHEIGVRAETSSLSQMRHRVKLYPSTPDVLYRPACKRCRDNDRADRCRCRRWPDERGDAKYQRESVSMYSNGRRVHAVCWHGFRDFFRAVYRVTPDARFATAMDTWRGSDDFERRFRDTGHKNIGSQACPVAAASACRCPESGMIGPRYTNERGTITVAEPVSLVTADMGIDDVLVQPDGISVERWSTYNKKMNDLLMGRSPANV